MLNRGALLREENADEEEAEEAVDEDKEEVSGEIVTTLSLR